MPIDPDFLRTLVCPKSHKPLRFADSGELQRANALIEAGNARNVGGEKVSDRLEAGLVPEGEAVIYPVRDDIPILLEQEAIVLDGAPAGGAGGNGS